MQNTPSRLTKFVGAGLVPARRPRKQARAGTSPAPTVIPPHFLMWGTYSLKQNALTRWRTSLSLLCVMVFLGSVPTAWGANRTALPTFNPKLFERQSVERNQKINDADALCEQATRLREQGSVEASQEAINLYDKALRLRRAANDTAGAAQVLYDMGGVYLFLSENRKASAYFDDALLLRRTAGDTAGEAWALRMMAQAQGAMGERRKALDLLAQALPLWRIAGERSLEAETLKDRGRLFSDLNEYPQALAACEESLALWRATGDVNGEASTLDLMSRIYFSLGNKEKLKALQTQAAQLRSTVANTTRDATPQDTTRLAAASVRREATGLLAQGTPEARRLALVKNEEALRLFASAGDERGKFATLLALSSAYKVAGEKSKAIDSLRQALLVSRAAKDITLEDIALRLLGELHDFYAEKREALDYYEQAVRLWRARGDRAAEASALLSSADLYRALDARAETLERLFTALTIYRELADRTGEAYALTKLMAAYTTFKLPPLAVFYGKQVVNLYQQIRSDIRELDKESQRGYLDSKTGAYRRLADLLISLNRLSEAEQVLRMLKDEEYFEFVRRSGESESSATARAALSPKEIEWQKRYDELAAGLTKRGRERGELLLKSERNAAEDERLKQLDSDLMFAQQAFQKFLAQLYDDLGKTEVAQMQVTRLEESQALMEDLRELGTGTVALYTLVAQDKYRVVLVTPDVQKAFEYPIKAIDLNRKVIQFREALQNPLSDPLPLAQELYKILIAPIAKDLEDVGAETLMWSLDGALRYMPIAALHDGKNYLIERYRNTVFTPASTARLKDAPNPKWKGLGVGVSKKYPGFQALKSVPEELRSVIKEESSPSPGGVLDGKILLDETFTEDAMRGSLRQRYPVVHIASHFVSQPGNAASSFLLLGDGKYLSLADIKTSANLFGGVDLLTLSACDTATGGTEADGKEVECFGVVAQRQGAKAVVATLWEVSDQSTQVLMQNFYRLRGSRAGMPKAEALRQGQLMLVHAGKTAVEGGMTKADGTNGTVLSANQNASPLPPIYAHPFFWAPFILIGNWR